MGSPPKNRPSNAPQVPSTSKWSNEVDPTPLRESRGFEMSDRAMEKHDPNFRNTLSNDGRTTGISYSSAKSREVDSRNSVKAEPLSKGQGPPPSHVGR